MEYSNTFYDGFCAGLEFAKKELREKKAVKRARWLPFDGEWNPTTGICSNCGRARTEAVKSFTNYKSVCPHCGAHMYLLAIDW